MTEPLEVGCAIIHKNGKLLIAQRHLKDSFGGFWEFPGGKREQAETIEACLEREVFEELGIRIVPERLLCSKIHGPRERRISLFFFFCRWVNGKPRAIDCKDFRWVSREEIRQYTLLPGDLEILEDLAGHWEEYFIPSPSKPGGTTACPGCEALKPEKLADNEQCSVPKGPLAF